VLHRIIRSRYSGHRWVGCYIWCSEEGPGLYDVPLLCGFNVAIKGLMTIQLQPFSRSLATEPTHVTETDISPAIAGAS